MTSQMLTKVPVNPLYNTSIKTFISPLSLLYLQEAPLIRVFYMIYRLNCFCMCPLNMFLSAENASDKDKQDLLGELDVMKNLPAHPNVVCLLGCCTGAGRDSCFLLRIAKGSRCVLRYT